MKKRLGVIALILAATSSQLSYSLETRGEQNEFMSFQEIPENTVVYPGQITLDGGKGRIYSVAEIGSYRSKLNVVTQSKVNLRNGENLELDFYPVTNYEKFIDRWSLEIYDMKDNRKLSPLKIVEGTRRLDESSPISVTLESGLLNGIDSTKDLFYIFKAYDTKGRLDETSPEIIHIIRSGRTITSQEEDMKEKIANAMDNRRLKNIHIVGANIKIVGANLDKFQKVYIDGSERELDLEKSFSYETKLEPGATIVPVELVGENGKKEVYDLEIDIPSRYNFLIGLADITVGENRNTGNEDILNPNYIYREDFFKTGRLAFYYNGFMNGYNITAHADTYEQDLPDMFKDFSRKDPEYYYRKLDYDPIEFNYGDDSVLYSDVDSQGKMYVKVEKEKNSILWGDYNTGFTGTKYGSYNRTLYGGRAELNTPNNTKFGDEKFHLALFGSQPDSIYAHDELLGTGGSFYYLSYRDIVVGSAKLSVQVKDPTTGRVLGIVELQNGEDYTINEMQGLIRLVKPLAIIIPQRLGNDIIQQQPLSGYLNYLVVDYEYYSKNIDFDSKVYGARAKTWLTDNMAIGGTYVDTNAGEHQYTLKAGDLTIKQSEGTYLRGEIAESEGDAVFESSTSINGGLDFFDREVGYTTGNSGRAYLVEGSLAFKDIISGADSRDNISGWYDKKEAGFSSAGESTRKERESYGGELEYQLTQRIGMRAGYEYYQEKDNISSSSTETKEYKGGFNFLLTDKVRLEVEGLHTEATGLVRNSAGINRDGDNGRATLAGAKLEYQVNSDQKIYIKGQGTIDATDGYEENNSGSIGTIWSLTDKLTLNGEVTEGTRGFGGDVGINYAVTDKYEIYSNYSVLNDGNGSDGTVTFGQSAWMSDRTRIYQENQFVRSFEGKGFTGGYGIDYQQSKDLWLGALYQGGELDTGNGRVKKEAVTLQSKFEKKGFTMRNALEYSQTKGSGTNKTESWGTANRFRKVIDNQYTVFGVANYLYGKNFSTDEKMAENMEYGLGLSYRPIWNDKLNLIGKYSYVYDLGSIGQLNYNYGEKAHVGSLDAVYEISQRWDIGVKYAYRKESVRVDRDSGPWFDSNLDLLAVRLNYEIIHKWDIFGEYHWLRDIEEDQIKHGAMVGIYREIGKNLQFGVGYNFTDFNDDLTNLDYRSQGWFVNLIGKF